MTTILELSNIEPVSTFSNRCPDLLQVAACCRMQHTRLIYGPPGLAATLYIYVTYPSIQGII